MKIVEMEVPLCTELSETSMDSETKEEHESTRIILGPYFGDLGVVKFETLLDRFTLADCVPGATALVRVWIDDTQETKLCEQKAVTMLRSATVTERREIPKLLAKYIMPIVATPIELDREWQGGNGR